MTMSPGALATVTLGAVPLPTAVAMFRIGVTWSTPVKLTDPASIEALPPVIVTLTVWAPVAGAFR